MSKCRSCGAPIEWVYSKSGKPIPVNAKMVLMQTSRGGATEVFQSHFATCPEAEKFRQARREQDPFKQAPDPELPLNGR